MSYSKCYN